MAEPTHVDSLNAVIEAYMSGVDMTLLRENLKLTPEQRVLQLQELARLAAEARRAGAGAARSGSE